MAPRAAIGCALSLLNPMPRRGASSETVVRAARRAAVLASLLALGAGWSFADPGVGLDDVGRRDISLLRPARHDLRIQWSAHVKEEGGEFLISRQGVGGPTSVVARVRPRSGGRYQVAQPGAAGSWIYELRYRDRTGREHHLATIHLNVESLDAERGVLTAGAAAQPSALLTAMVLPQPAATAALPAVAARVAARGPDRFPPTPPP